MTDTKFIIGYFTGVIALGTMLSLWYLHENRKLNKRMKRNELFLAALKEHREKFLNPENYNPKAAAEDFSRIMKEFDEN
jgi:hypothetical protein